jgi:hypothetical protein
MSKGKRILASTSMIAFLACGCAGQQTAISPDDMRLLASQPVYAVHYGPHEGFMIESSGYSAAGALLSPLAVLLAAAEGRGLRSELQLEDPVARTKARLISALQSSSKLQNVQDLAEAQNSDPLDRLKKTHGTGVMLYVRTTRWGIDNNRAKYQASARLVRLADSSVLWEATCGQWIADREMPVPTREQITADSGALLKAKLGEAADACADQLASWIGEKG